MRPSGWRRVPLEKWLVFDPAFDAQVVSDGP